MLKFTVLTLFPEMFASPLRHSILKKAQEKNLLAVDLANIRDYAADKHHVTDDYPYGGGQGMVMKPEPLVAAIEAARRAELRSRVILLSPTGAVFNHAAAARLAGEQHVVLVCGRYEGVDERVKAFVDEELSIGDYTLSGGEPAATVVIDAVARLLPGVLGNEQSPVDDSFSSGLLEYPQYTRPEEFRGMKVPDVLLSGDHERIKGWRREASLALTQERRPDLLASTPLGEREPVVGDRHAPIYAALVHYPVYDKNRQVVTTAVTNMDIHDITRAGRTYGLKGFYVVTPVKALQKLSLKIIEHWEVGYGSQYNTTRKEALALARIANDLDETVRDIERETGARPKLVMTSAREGGTRTSFSKMKDVLQRSTQPFLIVFGTGWGLTETVVEQADYFLDPIEGGTDYNHLSVRSAAAIVMDRLLGQ
ncbi:MAG: tRNA (guanosine(37)-N1)-methyltransferase TrmD [Deltaproteobacteria bacterium]|nr:tRNA (guanosine(37)-N1)-methyltransferase TrmD [Deltaproteobacteria bacterium]